MADIAFAFHWSPDAMRDMTLDELSDWHARAMTRIKAAYSLGAK